MPCCSECARGRVQKSREMSTADGFLAALFTQSPSSRRSLSIHDLDEQASAHALPRESRVED